MSDETLIALQHRVRTADLTPDQHRHALHNLQERRAELLAQQTALELELRQIDTIEAEHRAVLDHRASREP